MADEPTGDLNDRAEKEVLNLLREIDSTGDTFLIVPHSRQLVPSAARAFEMENGVLRQIQNDRV